MARIHGTDIHEPRRTSPLSRIPGRRRPGDSLSTFRNRTCPRNAACPRRSYSATASSIACRDVMSARDITRLPLVNQRVAAIAQAASTSSIRTASESLPGMSQPPEIFLTQWIHLTPSAVSMVPRVTIGGSYQGTFTAAGVQSTIDVKSTGHSACFSSPKLYGASPPAWSTR